MKHSLMMNSSRESYSLHLRSITTEVSALYRFYIPPGAVDNVFYGHIDEQSFRIIPQIPGRNHFTPIFSGRFPKSDPGQIVLKVTTVPFVLIWTVLAVIFSLIFLSELMISRTSNTMMLVSCGMILAATAGLLVWNHSQKRKFAAKYLPYLQDDQVEAPESLTDVRSPQEKNASGTLSALLPFGVVALKIICTIILFTADAPNAALIFSSSTFTAAFFAMIFITTGTGEAYFLLVLFVVAVINVWEVMLIGFLVFAVQKATPASKGLVGFYHFFSVLMLLESIVCLAGIVVLICLDHSFYPSIAANMVLSMAVAAYAFRFLSKHRAP